MPQGSGKEQVIPMSSIISRMFDSRSKEEKDRDYEVYSKRIFPFGEVQKEKVGDLLSALFPKEKRHSLMLHYILLKDNVSGPDSKGYEAEARKMEKKKVVKITPQFQAAVKILMDLDLQMDEQLQYPDVEKFRQMVEEKVEASGAK